MTIAPDAPVLAPRLLGPLPTTGLPAPDLGRLLALVEAAGLDGRGGAGFPTAAKLRAVAGLRPVLVGNAMEGEPLSSKDAVLVQHAPGLVVDGLRALGAALEARRLVVAAGPRVPTPTLRAAAATPGASVEVRPLTGGFVAGQETALVRALGGGPAVPTDALVPLRVRGLDGAPTLVLNAETLAQVALLSRYGAPSGTRLVTLGGAAQVVPHPGVLEVVDGTPVREVLRRGGTDPSRVRAVLVGGYHGGWLPAGDLDAPLSREGLAPYGLTPGAGVLHVLDDRTCPLRYATDVAAYLASQSARQCGPCLNGLPHLAGLLERLVTRPHPSLHAEVERVAGLASGRGACRHPDGTARFVVGTLHTFAGHAEDHLHGSCR